MPSRVGMNTSLSVRFHAISRPEFLLFEEFRKEADTLPGIVAKKQEISDGTACAAWSVADGLVLHLGRIFVHASSSFWPQLLDAAHGAGHEGVQKTVQRLSMSFFSLHATRLVRDHIKSCTICQNTFILLAFFNHWTCLHRSGVTLPWTSLKVSPRWQENQW